MAIRIEQKYYETVPTGRYLARVKSIEEREGEYGPYLLFTFELLPNEEGESPLVYGRVSMKFSNFSNLYAWTKAILGGGNIPRDYTFNSDELLNQLVYINVVEEEGENGPRNRIVSLSPYVKPDTHNGSPKPPHNDEW